MHLEPRLVTDRGRVSRTRVCKTELLGSTDSQSCASVPNEQMRSCPRDHSGERVAFGTKNIGKGDCDGNLGERKWKSNYAWAIHLTD